MGHGWRCLHQRPVSKELSSIETEYGLTLQSFFFSSALFLQVLQGLIYIILENEVKNGEGGPIFMYRHIRKWPGEAVLQLKGESTLLRFYPRSWVDHLCVFSHSAVSNSLQPHGL